MKKNICKLIVSILIFTFILGDGVGRSSVQAEAAASVISYSVQKGKTKKLRTIVNNSTLSKKKKDKFSKLTWKSSKPKIVQITGKKITAKKVGSAYIRGYLKKKKKKKKILSIKVTVQPIPKPDLVRKTSKGTVKGMKNDSGNAILWYGIPYGADTGGKNRWKAPQPVSPWTGEMKATTPKENALRADGSSYLGTEDCLYVNVYRPYTRDKNLPVLVYLHSGNNNSGTANVSMGELAAGANAVIVSVSYRLGAFGFLSHPALQNGTAEENSGNFTLLDIKQSLCWVRDEIANFGGNPRNVTLSGFSAGGRDVLMCMISPIMKGLFHKVIVLSGGMTVCTPQEGQVSVENKLAAILVKRGDYDNETEALEYIQSETMEGIRELFYSLTTEEIVQMYKTFKLRLGNFPQGFCDGTVLPAKGFEVIKSGNYNRVPMILGSDATEFSSFAWADKSFFLYDSIREELKPISFDLMDMLDKGILYGSQLQSAFNLEETAKEIYRDSKHAAVYAYRFCWGLDETVTDTFYSKYVGAYHGAAKDFLIGNYSNDRKEYSPNAIDSSNRGGRKALTAQMRGYIGNFLQKGNPNGTSLPEWTVWTNAAGAKRVMNFNAGKNALTSRMGSEYFDRSQILTNMKKNLTQQEYEFLVNGVLTERFFMP